MMNLDYSHPGSMKNTVKILLEKAVYLEKQQAWLINLKDFMGQHDQLGQYLTPQERAKYEKINTRDGRQRYGLRRALTRILLAHILKRKPSEVSYGYTRYGKPYLIGEEGLRFNLSHSKEYLLIGVAENAEIGVDIEKINEGLNHEALMGAVFSTNERRQYLSIEKKCRLEAFYRVWVQKEAISKAIGLGLSIGFPNFSVRIDPTASEEEYSIKIEGQKYPVKIKVKNNRDYIMATALIQQ